MHPLIIYGTYCVLYTLMCIWIYVYNLNFATVMFNQYFLIMSNGIFSMYHLLERKYSTILIILFIASILLTTLNMVTKMFIWIDFIAMTLQHIITNIYVWTDNKLNSTVVVSPIVRQAVWHTGPTRLRQHRPYKRNFTYVQVEPYLNTAIPAA
jgi:hypothetical protein